VDHQIFYVGGIQSTKICFDTSNFHRVSYPSRYKNSRGQGRPFRAQQTIKRFFGTAYHQFIFVKGGIEDQRDRGQAAELRDQLNGVRRYSAECWATKRADYYDRVMISQVWLSVVKPSNSRIASPRVVA